MSLHKVVFAMTSEWRHASLGILVTLSAPAAGCSGADPTPTTGESEKAGREEMGQAPRTLGVVRQDPSGDVAFCAVEDVAAQDPSTQSYAVCNASTQAVAQPNVK
jgi:hypothetical protein